MIRYTFLIFILIAFTFEVIAEDGSIHHNIPFWHHTQGDELIVCAKMNLVDGVKDTKIYLKGTKLNYRSIGNESVQLNLSLIGREFNPTGIKKTKPDLIKTFSPLIPKYGEYLQYSTIRFIVSSYQDIAWINTIKFCENERIHDMVVPALDTMLFIVDYRFEMEQTLNLMGFSKEFPNKKPAVIDAYNKGQFGCGVTFNQQNEGLESSEQPISQLHSGKNWIKDNILSIDTKTALNIDELGHSFQFSQILHKGGIKNFAMSRINAGIYRRTNSDGSSIFT